MADIPVATGSLPDGTSFQFFLDGVATYKQNERLIAKMDALVKRFKAEEHDISHSNKVREEETDLIEQGNKKTEEYHDALTDLRKETLNIHLATELLRGNFKALMYASSDTSNKLIALGAVSSGLMGMVGALTGYSDKMGLAMQRGVSGGVMDFAVAAKTSGLSLSDFTKALEESGGAFNKLGSNATDGAANFSQLINSVRSATASVGNLGLSNEQMAVFTAQQLKISVAQGMKGRQAQDFVIKNSRELGKELDDLASRTGKSVLEMAQAATKLAQDPIVASFVNSAKSMAPEVAAAVQKIAANYTALFGEAGAKIAEDAVKSAFGGLPFSITKTGQSLLLAGSAIYEEVQRQANMAKMGMDVTEADRERLNALVLQEVDARGVHAANLDGMRRAVNGLDVIPAYVLTDGYAIEGLGLPNLAVWKGDQVVVSISAASVIAKVTRDRIMRQMDTEFPLYGFAGHKGYITAAHTQALNEHGPCAQHRQSFSNVAALIHKQ